MIGDRCRAAFPWFRIAVTRKVARIELSPARVSRSALMHAFRSILICALLTGLTTMSGTRGDEQPLVFETHIAAVLKERCGKCHSDTLRKGDLSLQSMDAIRKGGESGEPLLAESVDDGLLWMLIDGGDMPPEGEPPLQQKEKDLIHRWLQQGARSAQTSAVDRKVNQHDVIPIMLLRCVTCHGTRQQKGGFDARTPASMHTGGKSGPAIVSGDPDKSLLIQRIESQQCPPSELLLKYFVRRPSQSEIETLRHWIQSGSPVEDIAPDIATTAPDPLVSDEDRRHWAFQKPTVTSEHTSIDEFIDARLQKAGLNIGAEAERDALIRRAYLDLVGIPPDLQEWNQWHNHAEENWYDAMIEHLLASPHYGERWGRYWLDVAGYADSEGGVSADPIRPVAWKYRDYVINAFNDNKPYDQFLLEQIAGDELLDHTTAAEITPGMVENLVATGFLRMGIDQTGSRTMNFVPERIGVIDDALTVLGSGVMGLTIGCARCHSHKYDAIPHRDYYRLKAVFQGALDEHDWLSFKTRALSVDTKDRVAVVKAKNPPLTAHVKKLDAARKKAEQQVQLELLQHHHPDLTADDRADTLKALRIADNNRTLPQRLLVEKLQAAELIPADEQPAQVVAARAAVVAIQEEIDSLQRQMEPSLRIRALWDRGEPSPTYILRRGEHDKPGRLVGPGVPSVLTDGRTPFHVRPPFPDGTPKTGRRLAFARWLTEPDHPLTARVFVNRVWYHHFGTGLVKSLENFGKQGEPPSHPQLLDWLAVDFVRSGWDIKQLHRKIMLSRTYRQNSLISEEQVQRDPQNRLLSRMSSKRLDAEALRDSLLAVSGMLDESPGGPPGKVTVSHEGMVSIKPTPEGRWRRSIYLQYRRTEIPTLMDSFDYPEMGPNCLTRSVSTVSPQALMLMNDGHVRLLAGEFAQRVDADISGNHPHRQDALIRRIYQVALSRNPSSHELELGTHYLAQLQQKWAGDSQAALQTYCHTILNTGAFLYVD